MTDSNKVREARIKNELDTHRPQLQKLSVAVRQGEQTIEFKSKELELYKKYPATHFLPIKPDYEYQTEDDYAEFLKEMKCEMMALNIALTEETQATNVRSLELESAKVKMLESGVEIYGISEETLLSGN